MLLSIEDKLQNVDSNDKARAASTDLCSFTIDVSQGKCVLTVTGFEVWLL
jgi:hypothetical protein